MKIVKMINIAFIFYLLNGCSTLYQLNDGDLSIHLSQNIKMGQIGVLTFYKDGYIYPSNLNKLAADWLSEELFLSEGFMVKDRVEINAYANELNIGLSKNISNEQVKDFNQQLNVKYLVVGHIYSLTNKVVTHNSDSKKLKMSIRIIDTESTSIVGVATAYSENYDPASNQVLTMIKKIVKELNN